MRATCDFPGCDGVVHGRGLCGTHYRQWRRRGAVKPIRRGGPHTVANYEVINPHAKGDRRWYGAKGYVLRYLPDHPNAPKSGAIMDHIVVMTEHLGRPLAHGETVHHKNGVRDDNRPENLELRVGAHFQGLSPDEAVAWAREILARYI